MKRIYFDHNASTPVYPEAREALLPYLDESYGNASSLHSFGQQSRKAIEESRQKIAKLINAEDPDEIIFTSGATESNNTVIKGVLAAGRQGNRIVSSAIEHSSVRQVLQFLAGTGRISNVVVPVQLNGILKVNDVSDAMTPDTILVSIMSANNEIGTIQPIEEIAALCRKKNIPFHCDAVQSAGKYPVDVRRWGVDFLSLSGHKLGAPKGIGILYVRKGTRLSGLVQGGSQEKNRRGGTENVPGIVAMGVAAEVSLLHLSDETKRLQGLRDTFEKEILNRIPFSSLNGDKTVRICNTSNICFDYTDNSALLMALDLKGLASSNGSACASGNPDPSHVLLALGLPQHKAHASLRFSMGRSTTEEDVRDAITILEETVGRLREKHPLWKEAANH